MKTINKIFLIFLTLLTFTSCINHDYLFKPVDIANLNLSKDIKIDAQPGMVTIVTNKANGDTIAISGVSTNITISKSTKVDISYKAASEIPEYKNGGVSRYNQTLAFEDTKKGDQDYNDLIVYVNQENGWDAKGYKIKLKITPIALGSTIPISFGFDDFAGNEYVLADDCRKKLFKSDKGFINTVRGKNAQVYKTNNSKTFQMNSTEWDYTKLNFWIRAAGNKLYIATALHSEETIDYNSMINSSNKPYGLSIPDVFEYSAETVSIYKTYPDFEKWIRGEVDNFRNTPYVLDNLYKQYYEFSDVWHF